MPASLQVRNVPARGVSAESFLPIHEQFHHFIDQHGAFSAIACVEDNLDMEDSYIMVDPHGRFFQNSNAGASTGYVYSRPILEAGTDAAFSDINFNADRFRSRYTTVRSTPMP
ncbi:MAG: hypothetical protein Q4D19_08630 [Lautropia sp.]|nr:hypothetical protein [Lautropia sp.]